MRKADIVRRIADATNLTQVQAEAHSSGFSGAEVQPRTDTLPKLGFAG
jgi:hypothetical protein